MELNDKQVIELKERLLALQEIILDIEKMFPEQTEQPVEVKKEEPKKAKKDVVKEVVKQEVKQVEEAVAEEEQMTVETVIEQQNLSDLSEDDLREILDAYEIKYTGKNKKQSLMEKVAQGILDGVIETEDEETSEESDEEVEEATEEAEELTPRQEAEVKILKEIDAQIEKGTLTKKKASEWLKKHFENGDCKECPKGCKDDPIDCYKQIKTSFVDDDGEVYPLEEAYMRDGAIFCCGMECEGTSEDSVACSICGQVYEYEEED